MQVNAWEQCRWAYLFDEGLIDGKTANVWAAEVWPSTARQEQLVQNVGPKNPVPGAITVDSLRRSAGPLAIPKRRRWITFHVPW
jgi:hypothetical protein